MFEGLAWNVAGEIYYDGQDYFEVKSKIITLAITDKSKNLHKYLDADFVERLENTICSTLLSRWIAQHNWDDAL